MVQYQLWPYAVRSWGFYPPEIVVQVPMSVFDRMVGEAPHKRPDWADDALASGQDFVLMRGRTFYSFTEDGVQDWIQKIANNDDQESI